MREEWPATIFVAAAFSLLDMQVGWLDAINGHAFVAIGNMAGMPRTSGDSKAKALVVLIDQAAVESLYLDRSPLDRCKLKEHIGAVYSAMHRLNQKLGREDMRLDLLVIDLDLSPARWLATDPGNKTREAGCESDLHWRIASAVREYGIRTVLMAPFDVVDSSLKQAQENWQKQLKVKEELKDKVTFGRAALPVEYGLVIKQYCDPDTLAASAYKWARKSEKARTNCINYKNDPNDRSRRETQHIDPRKYLSGVVPIGIGATDDFSSRLDSILGIGQPPNSSDSQADFRAVFFGAGFGEGDTFATPLGELYGVEIHAAGFLSLLEPISANNHLPELLVDIVFGFVFGLFIAYFWSRYFKLRLSDDPGLQLRAPLWLVGLGITVTCLAFVLTLLSWGLLARFGIWASPIPMAIGMLIESFVSGSVAQAIRVHEAPKAKSVKPMTFRASVRQILHRRVLPILEGR